MQILKLALEVCLVIRPRQSIHARRYVLLEFVERLLEQVDADVVEERGELLLTSFPSQLSVCVPAPVTRLPGSAPGTCFAGPHFPWSPPLAPLAPLWLAPLRIAPRPGAPLCSPASQLL